MSKLLIPGPEPILEKDLSVHAELHSVASHNDTSGTGTELDTLTDGSDADALHNHPAAGDVVYAENAEAGVSVASTSDITIATTDVTGVVAGDLLLAGAWFRIFNDSGGFRSYTITTEMESLNEQLVVVPASGQHAIFQFEWLLAVVSASEARFQGYVLFDITSSGSWGAVEDEGVWNSTASDLTGTVTVAVKVKSDIASGTQTLYNDGFVVRKISST